jgi:5-formyltetrahydrofolate cyclo-ligase
MQPQSPPKQTEKNLLRQEISARLRDGAIPNDPLKARRLCENFFAHFTNLDPKLDVSGTIAIRNEMDPHILMQALAGKGHRLCLPVLTERYHPLKFRLYAPGDGLEQKVWGLKEPPESKPEVEPHILLVPLLAFDRKGQRLGYGAGYYDATLSALRARKKITAIGFAHALQEVPNVPTGPRDQLLDAIVTEKEVILPPHMDID